MQFQKEIERRYKLQREYLGTDKPVNKVSPLVTVRTTTYQHGPYIEECIKGVLMQETNFPFEMIIGDDGSDDGTTEICKKYAEEHPDIIRLFIRDRKVSHIRDDKGNSIKRLNGRFTILPSRGKYMAICEGDDYWTDPLKLQKQVDLLEKKPNYWFVYHYSHIKKGNIIIGQRPKSGKGPVRLEDILFRKTYPTMSIMFRNPKLIYEKQFKLAPYFKTGDFLTLLLLSSRGPGYLFPEIMGVYRVHSGGVYSALSEIKKLQTGIHNRRAALQHIPMNFKQRMICRLMIVLRQLKIWALRIGLFR